jgi:hypothetical protein
MIRGQGIIFCHQKNDVGLDDYETIEAVSARADIGSEDP